MLHKLFTGKFSAAVWVIVISAIILGTGQAHAQVAGATLSGTVKDASGAAVPNAQVSITNPATGVTRGVTTDSAGFYTAPNLLPGAYEVSVSSQGFATAVLTGITLTVGAQQVLNPTLRVGQVSQKVVVTTEAPAVQLASSTLTGVVEAPTVVGLPLNGRSWTDLASLQPGVSGIQTQVAFGDSGRGNRGFGAQLSISGSRPQQNNYRLDGISINDYANGGPGSVLGGNLGVDAVEEFSVLTSSFSAEYGKTSGGVVNAISRAGTNQFHGSGFEFLRNNALDARNFFDPAKIPAFHRNQFGASAGGPIRKDGTFFFGSYEGIRQDKGVGRGDVVPSLAARGLQADGKTATAAVLCSIAQPGGCSPHSPDYSGYPGTITPNPDPTTGIDKGILAWLGMYPLPNGAPLGNGDVASFNFTGHRVVREDYFTTRIDHHFSDKDSLFGTYMFDRTPFTTDEPLGVVQLGAITKRQIFAVEETHTFNPGFVNTVRLGFNRDYVNNNKPVKAINPLAADLSLGTVPGHYAAGCQCPDGITLMEGGLAGAPIFLYRWNSYQVYDDAFVTRGFHSLKFGFSYERDQDNQTTFTEQNGLFAFGSMNAILTNQPKRLRATLPALLTERGMRNSIIGAYIQDDWRFRPSFMLNLGLRYEMSTVPFEVQGKYSNLYNLTDAQPHCGTSDPACIGTGSYFSNPTLRNFAPRVGFAWDPFHDGKTAVRGGFGFFDSLPMLYQFLTLNGRAYPYFAISGSTNLDPGSFPSGAFTTLLNGGSKNLELGSVEFKPRRNYVMQWNLNIQRELARDLTMTIGYVGSHGVHQPFRVDDADMVMPTPTSAGYLFPKVDALGNLYTPQCNQLDPSGTDPDQCAPPARINENAGSIRYLNWAGSSSYDALQLGVAKRLSHGFQVQGSFTWAKSIDTNSGVIAGDTFSNSISSLQWFDLKHLTRALSDFNIGRTLVISALWDLPKLKSASGPLGFVTNGWQLGAIFKANDGVPFSALFGTGGDPTGTLSSDDYAFPSRVAGCNPVDLNFRKNSNGPLYVNPSCFTVPVAPNQAFWTANCDPVPPSLGVPIGDPSAPPLSPLACFNLRGNSGRNIMVGPGLTNVDFSLFKNNPIKRISENFNIQFRAEFFNILNHANFNVPDLGSGNNDIFDGTGAANPTAGLLTSTTTDPREIQFALKFTW
jgi:hypothetical protein